MKKSTLVLGLVSMGILLGVSGCAGKFGHGNYENKMFSKYDKNQDGFVDKNEYFAVSSSRFERADTNNDGKVSKEEAQNTFIAKIFPEKIETWFNETDLNKDGYISYKEMKQKSKNEFLAQDINNDGKLSKEEMNQYKSTQRFKSMDTNNDGLISSEEFSNMKSPFN